MKESIPYRLQEELQGTIHYEECERAIISALESVYGNNEVPATNPVIARQRSFADKEEQVWRHWFQGSPQIQAEIDGKRFVFFDHRLPKPENLDDFPLLNPVYLRDHWSQLKNSALSVPRAYLDLLVDLSRAGSDSGVWSVSHSDIGRINCSMDLQAEEGEPYFSAFLGVTPEERRAYSNKYRVVKGDYFGLYFSLNDANQDEARGRVSVFGDHYHGIEGARFFGVRRRWASAASHSAEGATQRSAD